MLALRLLTRHHAAATLLDAPTDDSETALAPLPLWGPLPAGPDPCVPKHEAIVSRQLVAERRFESHRRPAIRDEIEYARGLNGVYRGLDGVWKVHLCDTL